MEGLWVITPFAQRRVEVAMTQHSLFIPLSFSDPKKKGWQRIAMTPPLSLGFSWFFFGSPVTLLTSLGPLLPWLSWGSPHRAQKKGGVAMTFSCDPPGLSVAFPSLAVMGVTTPLTKKRGGVAMALSWASPSISWPCLGFSWSFSGSLGALPSSSHLFLSLFPKEKRAEGGLGGGMRV